MFILTTDIHDLTDANHERKRDLRSLLSLATVLLMSLANKNIRLICAICGRLNNNFLVQFTFQKHLRAQAQFLIGKRLVRLGTHVNIKLKHTTNKYKIKIPHNYLSYTGFFVYLFLKNLLYLLKSNRYCISDIYKCT